MKILKKDLKHGIVKLNLTNLDDLWALYGIISSKDRIYARTTRELKIDKPGRPSSRRVPVFLGINVEKVYFDKEVTRLRIHGKVIDAPEDLNIKGKYHTLNLIVGESLTVVKDYWHKHQLKNLQDLTKEEGSVIIVAIDAEECCIALNRIYGIQVKAEINSKLPGKLETEQREAVLVEYFKSINKILDRIYTENKGKIVIVGPGFTKENFMRYIKNTNKELAIAIETVDNVSNGGISGVYEAIRVGIVNKVLKRIRVVKETALVEEVFRRLGASTGDIAFGLDEVAEDALIGAIDTILVCDDTLRRQADEDRSNLVEVIRNVEEKSGRAVIISNMHEAGAKLKSLGGVAALLRYPRHQSS
ncbi:mRNA surveillance protein pelota [[Eubacterium] cellulosolvens]